MVDGHTGTGEAAITLRWVATNRQTVCRRPDLLRSLITLQQHHPVCLFSQEGRRALGEGSAN
jgi:uncharacterized protein (DUF2126 family)